jgi:outer membrane murein-binding lipoprotein Lpp
MKKHTLTVVLLLSTLLFGCSKGADVDTFITEYNSFTAEVSKSVSMGDYTTAKATLDAKKDAMKTKCSTVKSAIQSNVGDQKKLAEAALNGPLNLSKSIPAGSSIETIAKMTSLTGELSSICF